MQGFFPEQLLTLNASINLLVSNCYSASCEAKMPTGSCVGHGLESKDGKKSRTTDTSKLKIVIKHSG